MSAELNHFIHVTCDFFAYLMAAACKAYLACNVENFLIQNVSYFMMFSSCSEKRCSFICLENCTH